MCSSSHQLWYTPLGHASQYRQLMKPAVDLGCVPFVGDPDAASMEYDVHMLEAESLLGGSVKAWEAAFLRAALSGSRFLDVSKSS